MKKYIVLGLLLFIGVSLFAVDGVEMLLLPQNAKIASMGEAYVAYPNDVSAINGNSAGLAWVNQRAFTGSYGIYLLDMSYFSLGGMYPLDNNKGVIGGFLTGFQYGSFDNYVDGVLNGQFDSSDFALTVSYSREIRPNIFAGANAKYVSQKLTSEMKGSGYGVDLSLFLKSPLYIYMKKENMRDLDLGIFIQNLGVGPELGSSKISLPLKIRGGMAYRKKVDKKKKFNLTVDIIYGVSDSVVDFNIGGEYSIKVNTEIIAFIRAGYMATSENAFRIGAGILYKQKYQINYALVNKGDLGYTHLIGIDYIMGKAFTRKVVKKESKKESESNDKEKKTDEQAKEEKLEKVEPDIQDAQPIKLND